VSITHWHTLTLEQLQLQLKTDFEQGLNKAEIAARLDQYGSNSLQEDQRYSLSHIFFQQFRDFMILVLLAAALISGLVGDVVDTIAIVVVVLIKQNPVIN
jgi:Ca2+-transporting ATPase